MDESKNLKLAREARIENNSESAKLYYQKVREEDPENGEAKFFYAYYSLYEGTNKEVPHRFQNLCNVINSSLILIKNSQMSKEEQLNIIQLISDAFVPEVWIINRYMNKKNSETKIGDSYIKIYTTSEINSCCKVGMFAIRDFGNQIINLYSDNKEAERIALIAWKEYVSLAQKWYAYVPKGEAEIYAQKIKKIDPSYEMPKKAGCISFANKK